MMTVAVSASSSGNNAVVAAHPGYRIRILEFFLVAAGSVAAKWRSADTTDITGAMTMATGVPLAALAGSSFDPVPKGATLEGAALNLNLSGGVQVSGYLVYDVVR